MVACSWLLLFNKVFSGTFAACIIPAILFYIEDCDVEIVKKQYERKLQLEKTAVAGLKVRIQVPYALVKMFFFKEKTQECQNF